MLATLIHNYLFRIGLCISLIFISAAHFTRMPAPPSGHVQENVQKPSIDKNVPSENLPPEDLETPAGVPAGPTFQRPVVIALHGTIDHQLNRYFQDRLQRAQKLNSDLLIIEIESPGGLKTVSLELAEQLRDIKWAKTVAYIPRRALSGGALIALGCDEIILGADAIYGDIGEIYADPELFAFRFVPAKIQSVLVRQARDLAVAKQRSPEIAEAMIDKDVMVYSQKGDEGRLIFQTVRVDVEDKPQPPWQLIEESGPERFLTINGARAVEIGFAQRLANNQTELLTGLGIQNSAVQRLEYNTTDWLVDVLNHPLITVILVVVGLLALYLEFSAPGIGIGSGIAGVSALLFFWSRFLGGTADWLEVVLFLAGLAFLLLELFVIPGWGVSGLLGLIMLCASLVMAGQDFVVPQSAYQWNQMITSLLVVLTSAMLFVLGAIIITKKIGRIPVFNQLVLVPPGSGIETASASGDKPNKPLPPAHPWVSVGDWGRTDSPLRPAGRVSFSGRSIDVISNGDFIERGTNVKVISIQGSTIVVSTVESSDIQITNVKNA